MVDAAGARREGLKGLLCLRREAVLRLHVENTYTGLLGGAGARREEAERSFFLCDVRRSSAVMQVLATRR